MAIGIAGDSPQANSVATFASSQVVTELLANILVELRCANNVTVSLTPVPPISLDNLRTDEQLAIITGNNSD